MAEARGGGKDRQPPEWWINIKQDLEYFTQARKLSQKFRKTIFRIRPKLRELNREHFRPEHLSLGLYDRTANDYFNPRRKGDTFRLAIVSTCLAELGKTPADWESICQRVVDSPEAIKGQYDEAGLDDLTPQDVRSMLCLDAFFLACFLGALFLEDPLFQFSSLDDVMARESSSFQTILLDDIIKLENQIPLVLIRNVLLLMYEILDERRGPEKNQGAIVEGPLQTQSKSKRDGDLGASQPAENVGDGETGRRIEEIVDELPRGFSQQDDIQEEKAQRNESKFSKQANEALQQICTKVAACYQQVPGFPHSAGDITYDMSFRDDCKHLLHCLYASLKLGLNRAEAPAPPTACLRGAVHKALSYCFFNGRPKKPRGAFRSSARFEHSSIPLRSASQLIKAGIEFRGQEGTFVDVKFKENLWSATLFLPRIDFVGDDCEPLWRNLVAFEDEHESEHEFKSYLDFMDDLIDTERDVALLKRGKHPVIVNNGLGSNKDVAKLFNSLLTNYSINRSSRWQDLREEIMVYYSNENRRAWVEFVRTKFGKPWLAVSLIAATVLLFLTLIQTVFAILTYEATLHPHM